ncbi:MAG TPA: hypothetical protein PLB46_09260 [Chitinophagales bacterium]|nr:hypothetical protein [Chitinophagales bacterium]
MEGALAGATGGASLIVTQAVSATARASIDYSKSEGLESWGGFIGDTKAPGDVLKDFISEGAGFAIGKGLENLNISGKVSSEFITKNSSINQVIWAEFVGQMAAAPFEAVYSGIADGLIYSPLAGNPISSLALMLNNKFQPMVYLETVHVKATRTNKGKVKILNIDLFNKTVEKSAEKNRKKYGYD